MSFPALVLTLFAAFQGQRLAVAPVSPDGQAILREFNDNRENPRLVGIHSPTCGRCLHSCADMQELLERYPDSGIRLLLLWAFQAGDNIGQARRAAEVYLSDARSSYF